ncbi:fasciclin domain-containing protein [Pedobacter psychroterrae]|uniref:FAS1 domain-containing protein n=1 Tax=Pedobacter psychroterrae TaxID=2530453 RepID=A0A4R0NKM7_9SPHI|nr:fasciclin domain-containing protein [Pedobacter psychroterrae]TCD01330.1 hypothetical protein EZ437_11305 [Pedobacter psychroterrae]
MKNIINQYIKPIIYCSVLLTMMVASCKQDDYYVDGGKADPKFKGNMMEYLESNPKFDTIAQIVKLAGMEEAFKNEELTFFAPTDEVIRRTIGIYATGTLNTLLFDLGKDTIKVLADVQPEIWRKYLNRYLFKGKMTAKDYPQLDFRLKPLYPGGFYTGYNRDLANIGVVYNPVNGVNYIGYRQLSFSYIPDPANPDNFLPAAIASSDIQPTNGVIHVIAVATGGSYFIGETMQSFAANMYGFDGEFLTDVILSK